MFVEIEGVRKVYQSPEGEIGALQAFSLSIKEGEFISIVGPSGCGKSTLLSIIAGLEKPSSGVIRVEGEISRGVNPKIGYMPQKDELFPWRTIWKNVTLGLEIQHSRDAAHRRFARELLSRYGLEQFTDCVPVRVCWCWNS